nr:hypothetical protein [Bacillus sp. NTK034]
MFCGIFGGNEYGEKLVGDLGFPDGATTAQIFKKAEDLGLGLCPLELGPYLRVEYLDQPEDYSGNTLQRNSSAIWVYHNSSEILCEDDDFPKGYYLRRINGVLWLRVYIADYLHVWNPNDHFIFCQT